MERLNEGGFLPLRSFFWGDVSQSNTHHMVRYFVAFNPTKKTQHEGVRTEVIGSARCDKFPPNCIHDCLGSSNV